MFCPWWFRWAVGHNAGHQGELKILRDRGLGSDEMFLAMMARKTSPLLIQSLNVVIR
jgi:hypothetical protein